MLESLRVINALKAPLAYLCLYREFVLSPARLPTGASSVDVNESRPTTKPIPIHSAESSPAAHYTAITLFGFLSSVALRLSYGIFA